MGAPRPFPHSLGLKLLLDWRARQAAEGRSVLAGDPYGFLAGCGFRFVEFATGPCLGAQERDLVRREARACAAGGLAVALHPYLAGPCNPARFGCRPEAADALQAILTAASACAELTAAPVTVIVHPAEMQYDPATFDPVALRAELLERSRRYFSEAERLLAAGHPGVRLVAEHQLPTGVGEPTIRIGDTCAELLRAVEGSSLALCWDTGHYIIGVGRYGQPDPPPDDFVRRVHHVHLHDVLGGVDHRVVGKGSGRLRDYMQLLQRSGFTGTVTLEYAWDAIQAAGGLEKVASEAPDTLTAWGWGSPSH
jgi:sugar phosphate isomerase/epimerase